MAEIRDCTLYFHVFVVFFPLEKANNFIFWFLLMYYLVAPICFITL